MIRTIDAIITRGDQDSLVAVDFEIEDGRVTIQRTERERRMFQLDPKEDAELTAWLEERRAEIEAAMDRDDDDPEDDFNGDY
jgi:hypothetical protein